MSRSHNLLVLAAALLVACGGSTPAATPVPAPEPAPVHQTLPRPQPPPGAVARTVTVFFGTDRAPDGHETLRFGTTPGELTVGVAHVSVPLDRMARPTGTLPDPPSTLGVRRTPAPARDLFVLRVQPMGEVYWDDALQEELRYDSTRTVVVFVHGFATPWEQALRRAAQLAVDLPFDGAMVVYSWPSLGEVGPLAYFRDDKTIAPSQPILRRFLERIAERSGAERVSIVAHSMGTLLVARTLKELHDTRPSTPRSAIARSTWRSGPVPTRASGRPGPACWCCRASTSSTRPPPRKASSDTATWAPATRCSPTCARYSPACPSRRAASSAASARDSPTGNCSARRGRRRPHLKPSPPRDVRPLTVTRHARSGARGVTWRHHDGIDGPREGTHDHDDGRKRPHRAAHGRR